MVRAIAVFVAVAVAALGAACVARPAAIQGYVLRNQRDTWAWRLNPFTDWMKKSTYRTYLRLMGAFLLLWAAVVIVAAFASH